MSSGFSVEYMAHLVDVAEFELGSGGVGSFVLGGELVVEGTAGGGLLGVVVGRAQVEQPPEERPGLLFGVHVRHQVFLVRDVRDFRFVLRAGRRVRGFRAVQSLHVLAH